MITSSSDESATCSIPRRRRTLELGDDDPNASAWRGIRELEEAHEGPEETVVWELEDCPRCRLVGYVERGRSVGCATEGE